jgi:uncharacterized protein (TIGR03083 family)
MFLHTECSLAEGQGQVSAIKAIEADRGDLLELCGSWDQSTWSSESGCPGWSVQDLVSHMACSFWIAVDPSRLPDPGDLLAERAADLYVDARRSMTPEEVLTDYETVSLKGLEILTALEGQDFEVPLGDVGTFPASAIPFAFAFEEFIHLRYDLFAPNGPLKRNPPAVDETLLAPTLTWIEIALPQQNSGLLQSMNCAVDVRLNGLCARTLAIGEGDQGAEIVCDSQEFVRWVTQRATWEQLDVRADGDAAALETVGRMRVI